MLRSRNGRLVLAAVEASPRRLPAAYGGYLCRPVLGQSDAFPLLPSLEAKRAILSAIAASYAIRTAAEANRPLPFIVSFYPVNSPVPHRA